MASVDLLERRSLWKIYQPFDRLNASWGLRKRSWQMFSVQCHGYLRKHRNSEARVTLRNNRGQLPLLIRWCVLRSTYIFAAFTVCRSIQFGCTGFSLSLTGFLPCFIWLLTRFSSIGFFFVVYTSTTHLFFKRMRNLLNGTDFCDLMEWKRPLMKLRRLNLQQKRLNEMSSGKRKLKYNIFVHRPIKIRQMSLSSLTVDVDLIQILFIIRIAKSCYRTILCLVLNKELLGNPSCGLRPWKRVHSC